MHYLNHTLTMFTLTMFASFGDKILAQLPVYTFSKKNALRIIKFRECNAHSSPLFHFSKIIKIAKKVKIENCLFINKYTNNKLSSIFTNWFPFSSMSHNYQTKK